MLSSFERILFVLLVAICLTAVANTFSLMARVIGRGQGQLYLNDLPRRVMAGIVALVSQGRILRHRKITSLFHYGVAFGFIFYGLVNLVDVAEGLIPGFHFFEGSIIGDVFRLAADLFAAAVLVGVVYFLLRRFAAQDPALKIRGNVKLMDRVREGGIPVDSLIVGLFILMHVGSRLLGASFAVAQDGPDRWQPVANFIAGNFMSGLSPDALNFGWHLFWWLAVGLILLFLPYFPYTKHAHLFMGCLLYTSNSSSRCRRARCICEKAMPSWPISSSRCGRTGRSRPPPTAIALDACPISAMGRVMPRPSEATSA